MSERQRCPICLGSGINHFVLVRTALPNRHSHPCHRCEGTGTIEKPTEKAAQGDSDGS